MDIGQKLVKLERDITALQRASRLSHASIEDTSILVNDATGSLRGILGVQSDGTTAVNIVNGAAPPQPSTPTVSPALGGIAVGWDGTFADSAVLPLDWSRVEVHASTTDGFTPSADTLQATMETPQGAIAYLPATDPTYVRLLARNTSGTASAPTSQVGPYSPRPVAGDIGIGEITETLISDGAITTPKLFANAVTTAKLAAGSVDAVALKADAITGKTITGGTITGSVMQTATSGPRVTINEAGANKILVYDGVVSTAIGELSERGLLVQGTNGSVMWLDPDSTYPTFRLTNSDQSKSAVINVSDVSARLGMNSGTFSDGTYSDLKWRCFFGSDFGVLERIRESNGTPYGGRLDLRNAYCTLGYINSDDNSQSNTLYMQAGLSQFSKSRLDVLVPASASSAVHVNADSGHTGYLLRLRVNSVDKFHVEADGMAVATNIASGQVTITPSAANTPTSLAVTGLNLTGTVRVVATANTAAPGTTVTGVGVTGVSGSGFTLWVTRTNTSPTAVNWVAIGT